LARAQNYGGSAEASGARFENLVTTWYAARALSDPSVFSLLGLPVDSTIVSIRCQTEAPVDDILIETSAPGFVFVQCKRRVQLGNSSTSALASAIDQFVLQWIVCGQQSESYRWARPLDPAHDRLVLAAGIGSSSSITTVLPRILRKLRDSGDQRTLEDIVDSSEERRVASRITAIVRRSFGTKLNRQPTVDELRHVLQLVWIQVFDIEDEGKDALAAREALANYVVADAQQAQLAFTTLSQISARLATERSGKVLSTLRSELRAAGILLRSPPTYEADIERLRYWTKVKLEQGSIFRRLFIDDKLSAIRRDVFVPLCAAVSQSSLLVTGEPGSGKSGVIYELAEHLAQSGKDVVFLPVDRLPVAGAADLTRELRVNKDLLEILVNWEGAETGYVIIDALDAARKFGTQVVFRELITSILSAGGRWRIIASVRKYDLRHGLEWRGLFKGAPPAPDFSDPEFGNIRHIAIQELSHSEITTIGERFPALREFLNNSPRTLQELLRTIFNLHLLSQLLDDGAASQILARIRTQLDLLESWWQHRILRSDRKHDVRERTLEQLLERMIEERSLQIARSILRTMVTLNLESLADLESHGVLRTTDASITASGSERVQFAHHILFDYAVARLTFARGTDPNLLIGRLSQDRDLALVLRPSLNLAFFDAWSLNLPREHFWAACFALTRAKSVAEVAKLAGPMIAAENAQCLDDLSPLISRLPRQGGDPVDTAARTLLSHLLGALMVLANTGRPLAGAGAIPWPAFAAALAERKDRSVMFSLRTLLWKLCEKPEQWTQDQRNEIGRAARGLLRYGWSPDAYESILVVNAIDGVLKTFATDVAASRDLLRQALDPQHMRDYAHSEMHWIARGVDAIAQCDPDFVCDLYAAAFGFRETSDQKTQMGDSQLLPLTSNRRQDFEMTWFQLAEAFPKFLASHPQHGLRALLWSVRGYLRREREEPSDAIPFVFEDIQTGIARDHSYSWRQFKHYSDALTLLPHLDAWFDGLALEFEPSTAFQNALRMLAQENTLAGIWASVMAAATRHPEEFGAAIVPLLAIPEVLTPIETTHDAGRCIAAIYPRITEDGRVRIERAVLALSGELGARAQLILLGTIPDGLFATAEARDAHDKAVAEKRLRPNRPPIEFTSSSGIYDSRAYLRDQGVNVESEETRRVLSLEDKLKAFAKEHLNATPKVDNILKIWPEVETLWAEFLKQETTGDARIVDHALSVLAETVARVVQADLSNPNPSLTRVRARTIEILQRASRGHSPEFDEKSEEQFNTSVSWGSPSARIEAAQGTMALLRHKVKPELLEMAGRLLKDKVAAVRWHIAHLLFVVSKSDIDFVWSGARHILEDEQNYGVIGGFVAQTLPRLVAFDQTRVIDYAQHLLARLKVDGHPGADQCVQSILSLFWDLYIWRNDDQSKALVFGHLDALHNYAEQVQKLLVRQRETLVAGALDNPSDEGNGARDRTFTIYQMVAERSFGIVSELLEHHIGERFDSWTTEEQQRARENFTLLDIITRELYFASGAYSRDGYPNAPLAPPNAIQRRFYAQALPLFNLLAQVLAAPVAHHLIETLEFFIPLNPAEVFRLVATSIRTAEAGGYTLEHMGSGLFVRIVERYLADHRDVFADPKLSDDLLDALDAFVRAGWPDARALTYRIADIWR
jgi:hypothetical protein